MRQGRPEVRGRFVQIEPRLSLTAASADRWTPIRPGTEGLLALGIGKMLFAEKRSSVPKNTRQAFEKAYGSHSLDQIAAATEVPRDEILRIAREFSGASASLAIGGGAASSQTNGTPTLMAVNALNLLAGNMGKPSGLRFFRSSSFTSETVPVGEDGLLTLADEFRSGHRTLLHLYDVNPFFSMPPSTRFGELFEHAEFVVSFSSFMDESTAMADLILPSHVSLETWDDHPQTGLTDTETIGLAQPVVTPLYDTRPVGDLLLQAAKRLDGSPSSHLPWDDFKTMLEVRWKAWFERTRAGVPFETAWIEALQRGGWWREDAGTLKVRTTVAPPPYTPPVLQGESADFPFYFYPFPSMALGDGRGANRPWLQELPDTLTTVAWGSWVEINPQTAQSLGLRQGELVRVVSPFGAVEAPVVFFPGIRPDLIAMPIGQGHTSFGRYARGRGANPLSILGPAVDEASGCLAAGATRVRVERTGKTGTLVMLDQSGRAMPKARL